MPTPLTVPSPRPSCVNGRRQANALDCLPLVNLKPFGVCAITHGPCLPVLPFWTQAHPGGYQVGGALPLIESSVCQCGLGGRISITVLPVPGGAPTGIAGLAVDIAADWQQQEHDAHDPNASEEVKSHALSGRLQLVSAGIAVVGLSCAVAGFFFPPLAVMGAAVLAVSEVLFVAAVAIDVIVLKATALPRCVSRIAACNPSGWQRRYQHRRRVMLSPAAYEPQCLGPAAWHRRA